MKNRIFYILFFVFFFSYAHAETIVLHTGARVKGEIVFQNEEVVIVRNAETGGRIQYPRAEVEAVLSDEEPTMANGEGTNGEGPEAEITTSKKASILVEIAGGAAVVPNESAGGMVSADLLVGSHHIGDRHLFIGGGLGYHGLFMGADKYNFLPVQVALRMPFTEAKHAPVFGMSVGYGIALSKDYVGGIYAGADLGYRCQINPKTAMGVVLFAQFQQVKVDAVTTIEGVDFTSRVGRNIVMTGLKLAFYL